MDEPLPKSLDPARMTIRDLVDIAHAAARQAVCHYAQMANLMQRRGQNETTQAFRRMLAEKREHVAAIERWARGLGQSITPADNVRWKLPPEFAASWQDLAGSALLTPYRAFANAVRNEERVFSMYSYLAAHARDPAVATEAEKLAAEALARAALLRRWRRNAYHRGTRPRRRPIISSVADLQAFAARRQAEIADQHRALAEQLRRLGDEESARLLEEELVDVAQEAAHAAVQMDDDAVGATRLSLLITAQKPLEELSEELEAIITSAPEPVSEEAEKALTKVIARLARIAAIAHRRAECR